MAGPAVSLISSLLLRAPKSMIMRRCHAIRDLFRLMAAQKDRGWSPATAMILEDVGRSIVQPADIPFPFYSFLTAVLPSYYCVHIIIIINIIQHGSAC